MPEYSLTEPLVCFSDSMCLQLLPPLLLRSSVLTRRGNMTPLLVAADKRADLTDRLYDFPEYYTPFHQQINEDEK